MIHKYPIHTFYVLAFLLLICLPITLVEAADKNSKKSKSYRGPILEMTGDDTEPVKVWDASGQSVLDPYYAFEKKGLVLVGRDYSLRLDGGRFFSAGAEEYLNGCLKSSSGVMTIAVYINPVSLKLKDSGCIIGFGPKEGNGLFSLAQKKKTLLFKFGEKLSSKVKLLNLSDSKPFHLILTFGKKEIVVYRDGKKVGTHSIVRSQYVDHKKSLLFFGNDEDGKNDWHGRLERFSLYNKVLSKEEASKISKLVLKDIKELGGVPTIEFTGKLLARSKYPMPWKEGFTYREVLTVCEYEVTKVLNGDYKKKKIRVAEWAYVDRIFLKNIRKKIGSKQQLIVEEFDENPQLATLERADTLELDIDATTYYDLSPLKALSKKDYPKPPKKENKK